MSRVVEIVLYSQPSCGPCASIKGFFKRHQIPYLEIDVQAVPEALEKIQALGYRQTPVTEVVTESGSYHWGGLDMARLTHLKSTR